MKTFNMILMSLGLAIAVTCIVLLPITLLANPTCVDKANALAFMGMGYGSVMTVIYYSTNKFENISKACTVLLTVLYCLFAFTLASLVAA